MTVADILTKTERNRPYYLTGECWMTSSAERVRMMRVRQGSWKDLVMSLSKNYPLFSGLLTSKLCRRSTVGLSYFLLIVSWASCQVIRDMASLTAYLW